MKRTLKWMRKMMGITVLEVMLALAVSALIIIAVVMFYNATKTSASVSKVISDMNGIVAAADTYIAGGGAASNLAGDNDPISTLQGAGLLPNTLNDPWGLPYTATVTASTASTATITIAIPGAVSGDSNCSALVSATASQSNVTPVSGGTCSFTYQL